MPPKPREAVEGADDAILAAVTRNLPALPNIRAEDPDRFAQGILALVEKRAQATWPNEGEGDDVAAFVMVDRPREMGDRFGATPVLDPIAKTEPLLGRLFFMNRDGTSGRGMPLPCEPSSLLDWLTEQGMSDHPLVLAYRGTSTLTVRREGVDDRTRNHHIRDKPPTATMEELLDALNYFHLNKTLTPTCCVPGVWESQRSSNYVPGPQPERSIQRYLELALNFWFHGVVRAEVEDSTNIGRIDVRLLKPSAEGPLYYWAIVELKVIKSFANASGTIQPSTISRSANIAAIIKGLQQAWAYRSNRDAEEGLLEIFDLRREKNDDLMANVEVTEELSKLDPRPTYHVRAVFGSAEDARQAGYCGI